MPNPFVSRPLRTVGFYKSTRERNNTMETRDLKWKREKLEKNENAQMAKIWVFNFLKNKKFTSPGLSTNFWNARAYLNTPVHLFT